MSVTTDADVREFRYLVPARLWFQHQKAVMQRAAREARKHGKRAAGRPDEEHVILVWRQEPEAGSRS